MGKNAKIVLVTLLALGLRLINLNQSFWLDEASQAQQSAQSLTFIWSGRAADFHPPLFYFLAHELMHFGRSEAFLRLLPVFFGVLAIPALYFFCQKLFNSGRLAIFSALFLAINPYHIYYSQEFRSYSLLTLLGIFSMHLFFVESNWLFIVNALVLYTHYSGGLLIAAQVLYFILFRRHRLKWLAIQLTLSLLLFLPWLPQFREQLQAGVNIDSYLPGWRNLLTVSWFKAVPLIIFKFVAGRINLLSKLAYGMDIIFVFAVTALAFLLAKAQRKLVYSWLFIPIGLSLVLSIYIPQTQPFRLIYCLPALVIIFAQAADKYPKLFLTLVIYICVFGNVLYFTRPRLQREQWRQAIAFLGHQNASILVKFSDKFAPFYWYNPNLEVRGVIANFPARKPLDLTNLKKQVFLVEYLGELTDPEKIVDKQLAELEYSEIKEYNFEGVGIIKEFSQK